MAVTAQTDPLFEVVHGKEVFLPLRIDGLKHDHLHEIIHQRRPEFRLLLFEVRHDFRDDRFLGRLRGEIPALFGESELQGKMSENPLIEALDIPLLGMAFFIDILRDDPFDHFFDHLLHIFPERLSLEDLFTLLVDHFSLAVHDVIVFEQVLADIEILSLDTLLGILDRLGNQPMFDRLSLLHTDPVHDRGDPFGAEYPEEIILEGKIEPRRPHISLPPRTAAELVVDAPALVSLRTEDMETSQFCYPLAQLDVRTAAGHVGRDRHLTRLAGLGDNLRLALMIFCIQHVVFDPRAGQIFTQ